jgi:hypothetical protein
VVDAEAPDDDEELAGLLELSDELEEGFESPLDFESPPFESPLPPDPSFFEPFAAAAGAFPFPRA